MLLEDAAHGFDVSLDGPEPPPGRAVKIEPLVPLLIPPPDWRAEENAAARQAALDPVATGSSEPGEASKAAKAKATPNRDRVRAWRETGAT